MERASARKTLLFLKQPNRPICSISSTGLFSKPSRQRMAKTTLGTMMTSIKNQPEAVEPVHLHLSAEPDFPAPFPAKKV